MIFDKSPPQRRFLVPEVVQTSAMDCGPAALKSLLAGFDIEVSYGRLREACQTSVDGTSIDTLEEIANQLGLIAQQLIVPADHLFLPGHQILPALTVIRLPNGLTHFVIIWRRHGQWLQIMDPGTGRRWIMQKRFLNELYLHTQAVPIEAWYQWAISDGFCDPLRERLAQLKIAQTRREALLQSALATTHWQAIASLDAATRMVETLVQTDGLQAGKEAEKILEKFYQQNRQPDLANHSIPSSFWLVKTLPDNDEFILFQGAVLIQINGRHADVESEATDVEQPEPLPPELTAALTEKTSTPEHNLWQLFKTDGLFAPSVLFFALALATVGVTIEILLFKSLLELGQHFAVMNQRMGALEAVLFFFIIMLSLEIPIAATGLKMGRHLETRLRLAFLAKIPRLGDRYFHSRLTSDMTERAYELRLIRSLPELAVTFFRLNFTLLLTTAGIIWITPASFLLALFATITVISLSFFTQPWLREQDLRFRTHDAALSRFYLDALLGLVPLRTHSAAHALRNEHESLLVNWVHAGWSLARTRVSIIAIESLINTLFAIWIVWDYIAQGGEALGVLLVLYWTLKLPMLGQQIASTAQQYPTLRNRVLRLLEPLTAPEESEIRYDENRVAQAANLPPPPLTDSHDGVAIELHQVDVKVGGQTILQQISLHIAPGEQIAIVGASGAGKSSLVGLLLGWYSPAVGLVRVDGQLLQGDHLQQLRQTTAWVDPSVQIWNRSLQDNLYYGTQGTVNESLETVITQADLSQIIENLSQGINTPLGEGGGLVSGGEGQRVRLARAMLRPNVRLVILDEPFRGLDREKRRLLLARMREYWSQATLLFISHDVGDTQTFSRVMVIENGQLIEDEHPKTLQQTNSRYRNLLEAEQAVRQGLWESTKWRHLWLEKGKLQEMEMESKAQLCQWPKINK